MIKAISPINLKGNKMSLNKTSQVSFSGMQVNKTINSIQKNIQVNELGSKIIHLAKEGVKLAALPFVAFSVTAAVINSDQTDDDKTDKPENKNEKLEKAKSTAAWAVPTAIVGGGIAAAILHEPAAEKYPHGYHFDGSGEKVANLPPNDNQNPYGTEEKTFLGFEREYTETVAKDCPYAGKEAPVDENGRVMMDDSQSLSSALDENMQDTANEVYEENNIEEQTEDISEDEEDSDIDDLDDLSDEVDEVDSDETDDEDEDDDDDDDFEDGDF